MLTSLLIRATRPLLIAVALMAVLLALPASASAMLPTYAWVFGSHTATSDSSQVSIAALPMVTREYDVILRGTSRSAARRVSLTGVPLVELLKAKGTIDPTNKIDIEKVPFVKIRFGDVTVDRSIALVALTGVADGTPPPMILSSGAKPGIGKWHTPSIVPGQPGSQPLNESQIRSFDARRDKVAVIPARQAAQILAVSVTTKHKSNGEWLLTAKVHNPPKGPIEYRWYAEDGIVASGKRYATTNATTGRAKHSVNLVVTSQLTGSTGAASFSYTSRNR